MDELERLRNSEGLVRLLDHYVRLGQGNPDTWQDRLMCLEGVDLVGLAKLHGELIAFSLVEQNTGQTPVLKAGVVAACYRVTAAGTRALQSIQSKEEAAEAADSGKTAAAVIPGP